jgi:HEAT repeat protein
MTRRALGWLPRVARRGTLVALLVVPTLASAQLGGLGSTGNGGQNVPNRSLGADRGSASKQAKLDEAVKKFQDEDLPTKLEGITELGNVDDRAKAVDYLLQGANDPQGSVRLKAIDVLGNMKAKEAVPSLVQQLFMRDTDKPTKQHVLVTLGKIGDPKATRAILDYVARPGDEGMDANAIYALGDIGDKRAIPALQEIAQTGDPKLRPLATDAIQRIREKPEPAVVPPALAADRRRAGGEAGAPNP